MDEVHDDERGDDDERDRLRQRERPQERGDGDAGLKRRLPCGSWPQTQQKFHILFSSERANTNKRAKRSLFVFASERRKEGSASFRPLAKRDRFLFFLGGRPTIFFRKIGINFFWVWFAVACERRQLFSPARPMNERRAEKF